MIQTIGIIGSGAIGSALARLAIAAGIKVVVSNSRSPKTLTELVNELGSLAKADTPENAAKAGDIVIVAIPFKVYRQLPTKALNGKIVIDTMNYYPERDGDMEEVETGNLTTSELVQQHLSESKVVKTFQNLDYVRLFTSAHPSSDSYRSALPVSGDDDAAKAKVMQLMDALGYDAVNVGKLADSWRQEPRTPVYVLPYVGQAPEGLSPEEAKQWFFDMQGVPVPAGKVKELISTAVRQKTIGGSISSLPAGMPSKSKRRL